MTNRTIISLMAVIVIVAVGFFIYTQNKTAVPPGNTYSSVSRQFSFDYPSGYYLYEREVGTIERPQLALVLVEDTQENRDLLAGKPSIPREGPTAVTIDVYPNPEGQEAATWLKQGTNWDVRIGEPSKINIGGKTGLSFRWSGLYEGKSTVVTTEDKAFVFSVTWLTTGDSILSAYDKVTSSAKFSE